jgi:hypothetical protein
MQADTKGAFVDAVQSRPHIAEQVRLAVQVSNRQLALSGILDFIQGIRALFDCDSLTVSQHLRQLSLFRFQDFFEFV